MGTAHLPLSRRLQQTAHARAAYPPLSQRSVTGGTKWAKRYSTLPPQERARIIARCVLGWYRYDARRRGLPDPIPYIYEPMGGDDGKVAAKSGTLRPMTDEEIAAL
jgi:hypothetical protein